MVIYFLEQLLIYETKAPPPPSRSLLGGTGGDTAAARPTPSAPLASPPPEKATAHRKPVQVEGRWRWGLHDRISRVQPFVLSGLCSRYTTDGASCDRDAQIHVGKVKIRCVCTRISPV
jgi:hypothetical protein